jgi:hypothetical protein
VVRRPGHAAAGELAAEGEAAEAGKEIDGDHSNPPFAPRDCAGGSMLGSPRFQCNK